MRELMSIMRKVASELNLTLTSDTMALILAQYWRECQVNSDISLEEVMKKYLSRQEDLKLKEIKEHEYEFNNHDGSNAREPRKGTAVLWERCTDYGDCRNARNG